MDSGGTLTATERGCLVIADITGYTGFLAGSELEHAQAVLRDLMTVVVGGLRPTFKLAKLEGDAAFVYAVTERIDGSQLLDTLEATYFAFRSRLDSVDRATTCQCNACVLIPSLNLKLFAHHGTFIRERIFGTTELTGTDVVVIHRLLKNSVAETTGLIGYALLTDGCLAAAGLDPTPLELREHRETYESLGEIRCWLHDLERAWRRERELRRVRVTDRDTMTSVEAELPVSPARAWSYLTDPLQRPKWVPAIVRIDQSNAAGRRGVGTTNHCVHGDGVTLEEILDWRPFDYFTMRTTIPEVASGLMTYELEPLDVGTRVRIRFGRPRSKQARAVAEQLFPQLAAMFEQSFAELRALIAAEEPAEAALAG